MGGTEAKQKPVDYTGQDNPNFILKPGYDTVKTETTNIDTIKGTQINMDPENGNMENSELTQINGHTETFITNEINGIFSEETLNNNTKGVSSLLDHNSTKRNAVYSDTALSGIDNNVDMQRDNSFGIHQEAGIPMKENTFLDNHVEQTRKENFPAERKNEKEDSKDQNDKYISTVFVTDESIQKMDSVLEQENSSKTSTSGNEVPVIDAEMTISDDNVRDLSEPMSLDSSKNGNSKKKSVSFDSPPSVDAFSDEGTPVASLQSAGCKQLKYRYDTGSVVGICVDFDEELDSVVAGEGDRHSHLELENLGNEEHVDTMAKVREWEGVNPRQITPEENGIAQSVENGDDQYVQVTESICHTNEVEVQEMIIVEESKSVVTETPNAELETYKIIDDKNANEESDNQRVIEEILNDEVQVYTVTDTTTGETKSVLKEPDKQVIPRNENMLSNSTTGDPQNVIKETEQQTTDKMVPSSDVRPENSKQTKSQNQQSEKVDENPEYIYRTIVDVRPDVMCILSPVKEEASVKPSSPNVQQTDSTSQFNVRSSSHEQSAADGSTFTEEQQNKEKENENCEIEMQNVSAQGIENSNGTEKIAVQVDVKNSPVEAMNKEETGEILVAVVTKQTEENSVFKANITENEPNTDSEPVANYKTVPLNDVYRGKISNKHAYAKPNPIYHEDETEEEDKSPKRKDKKGKKKGGKKTESKKKINGSIQKKSSESIEVQEHSEARENSLYSDDSAEMQGYDRLITKTTQQRRRRRICCMLAIVIVLAMVVGGAGALLAIYLPQNQ